MPKKIVTLGHYVIVSPEMPWRSREHDDAQRSDERAICEQIGDDIKRHVDNVESVHIRTETQAECEFCGSLWTEKSDTFNGGCCAKDPDPDEAILATTGEPT